MTLNADITLDCSGLSCPLPIVKTSKAMKELTAGQVLKMIATDSGAPADMEAWARQTGNTLLSSLQLDNKYVFFIQKANN